MRHALPLLAALTLSISPAIAHDGHGLGAPHWHATDGLVFVALAIAIGAALWVARGGK